MTSFGRNSREGDPQIINPAAGDWQPDRSGPEWEMGVGWLTAPQDVNK
jgi:hypothetical protein